MDPVILIGGSGGVQVATFKVCEEPVPHALFARTEIVPPLEPAVVVIEDELDDPVQPEGRVQV